MQWCTDKIQLNEKFEYVLEHTWQAQLLINQQSIANYKYIK